MVEHSRRWTRAHALGLASLIVLSAGCLAEDSVRCKGVAGEWFCPAGTVCDDRHGCLHPQQLSSCLGAADGDPCSYPDAADGRCLDGVCLNTTEAFCSNARIDPGEACDLGNLAAQTCQTRGYTGGDLACDSECQFDESGCTSLCGNGIREPNEPCDGAELGGATCALIANLPDGELTCSPNCSVFDASDCHHCGNGTIEGPEACDGSNLGAHTCLSLDAPGGGTPSCSQTCTLDTSTCCQDADGDGYGPHCVQGGDCDDTTPGIVGSCLWSGCPTGYILIPAGDFQMGCDDGDPCWVGLTQESPRHLVTLAAYCIAKTETSVAAYRSCLDAGVCSGVPTDTPMVALCNWTGTALNREHHPINCVTWDEAQQYCQFWEGGDLPTEAQWEKAARGAAPDQRTYPWGDSPSPDCTRANFDVDNNGPGEGCASVPLTAGPATWEVGALPTSAGSSPYGVRDMAGNVEEWTRGWYDPTDYTTCASGCSDPLNTDHTTEHKTVRGGAFSTNNPIYLRTTFRLGTPPWYRAMGLGFRCVRTP